MGYTSRQWQDGELVTARLLNSLEQRIGDAIAAVPVQVTDDMLADLIEQPGAATATTIGATIDAHLTEAVAEGAIPTAPPTVTEIEPGVYEFATGPTVSEVEPGVYVIDA